MTPPPDDDYEAALAEAESLLGGDGGVDQSGQELTRIIRPATGKPATREQQLRHLANVKQANAPTQRIDPGIMESIGTGVHKGLWNMLQFAQGLSAPAFNPKGKKEWQSKQAARNKWMKEEYFQPYEEARPASMMAGGGLAQAPFFMAGGEVAPEVAPIMGRLPGMLGRFAGSPTGSTAIMDALAAQPGMDPNTPIADRLMGGAMAGGGGMAARGAGGMVSEGLQASGAGPAIQEGTRQAAGYLPMRLGNRLALAGQAVANRIGGMPEGGGGYIPNAVVPDTGMVGGQATPPYSGSMTGYGTMGGMPSDFPTTIPLPDTGLPTMEVPPIGGPGPGGYKQSPIGEPPMQPGQEIPIPPWQQIPEGNAPIGQPPMQPIDTPMPPIEDWNAATPQEWEMPYGQTGGQWGPLAETPPGPEMGEMAPPGPEAEQMIPPGPAPWEELTPGTAPPPGGMAEPQVTYTLSDVPSPAPTHAWVDIELPGGGKRATLVRVEEIPPTGRATVPLSQAPQGVQQQVAQAVPSQGPQGAAPQPQQPPQSPLDIGRQQVEAQQAQWRQQLAPELQDVPPELHDQIFSALQRDFERVGKAKSPEAVTQASTTLFKNLQKVKDSLMAQHMASQQAAEAVPAAGMPPEGEAGTAAAPTPAAEPATPAEPTPDPEAAATNLEKLGRMYQRFAAAGDTERLQWAEGKILEQLHGHFAPEEIDQIMASLRGEVPEIPETITPRERAGADLGEIKPANKPSTVPRAGGQKGTEGVKGGRKKGGGGGRSSGPVHPTTGARMRSRGQGAIPISADPTPELTAAEKNVFGPSGHLRGPDLAQALKRGIDVLRDGYKDPDSFITEFQNRHGTDWGSSEYTAGQAEQVWLELNGQGWSKGGRTPKQARTERRQMESSLGGGDFTREVLGLADRYYREGLRGPEWLKAIHSNTGHTIEPKLLMDLYTKMFGEEW